MYLQQFRHISATLTRRVSAVLAIVMGAVGATSCGSSGSNGGQADISSLPQITVTVPPLAYFAQQIGGDSLDVTTLMPAGADPESFEPGLSAMRNLSRSGNLAVVGLLPFEKKLVATMTAGNRAPRVFTMAEGIDLIYGTHSHSHSDSDDDHHHDKDADPHVWSSVKNGRIIADNMLRAILAIAPEHETYYRTRHAALTARLDSIDAEATRRLGLMPSRAFVIWHPSLSYMARDYNLDQLAVSLENKESSSQQIHRLIAEASQKAPVAFLIPAGTGNQRASAIAESLHLPPVEVNLMSADWETDITEVIDNLTSAK